MSHNKVFLVYNLGVDNVIEYPVIFTEGNQDRNSVLTVPVSVGWFS